MTRIAFLALAIFATAAASPVRADTIFEVEHARADARAGLVSEYDEEILQRWGALSGSYPPRLSIPQHRRPFDRRRNVRRTR